MGSIIVCLLIASSVALVIHQGLNKVKITPVNQILIAITVLGYSAAGYLIGTYI